ncbi:MAG TPA: hypothetical protein PKX92_08635 [Edaphocola sp.]|nr:hypothetical protein [Edaphocola sp.]
MNKKKLFPVLLISSFTFLGNNTNAQDFSDVLRYSSLKTGTTARTLAIGGAAGSLGADYSAASVNPAGLGVYRQNQIIVTPYLSLNNTSGKYIGQTAHDNNTAFKLRSLAMVLNQSNSERSGWKGLTFAVGVNKLADFNTNSTIQGINNQSSFSELMAFDAQNYGVNESGGPLGFLGYQSYLLTNDFKSVPYHNVIAEGGTLKQTQYKETKGAVNEYTLSIAGNYDDKFMIGGTLGITTYKFNRTNDFLEADNTGSITNGFNSFTFRENLQSSGVGINGKFGVIYAASPAFRFGASIHTPTAASMTDLVDYNVVNNLDNGTTYDVSPQSLYRSDYTITTPMRGIVSATGFFGNSGFITGDVEVVPFNTMRIRYSGGGVGNSQAARAQNDFIRNNFKTAINARLGAEARLNRDFALRVGVAYYGNPYQDNVNNMGGETMDYSLGIGYQIGSGVSLDFTYTYSQNNYKDIPYSLNIPGVTFYDAAYKNNRNVVALTLGIKY